MSVDRSYSVRIDLKANTAGAAEASEALKGVGKASTAAGEEGNKSAEGMFESHTELRHLLHGIGEDAVPGMGRAFSMLAMGPLGAVVALTAVVEFLKRGIDDANKQLDALAANSAKAFGGGDYVTDYANALAQAATEAEATAEALKKAADAGPEIKNRYDEEAKGIQAVVAALKEKLKTQEESDLADARKRGASPEEENAIRARYESRDQAVQDAAEQQLQQARQRELLERQRNDPALKDAASATETPVKTSVSRTERQAQLAAQEQALAKATSDLNTTANDELNDRIEGLKYGLENMRKNGTRENIIKAREAEIASLESQTAESREADAKDRIGELSKEVLRDQSAAATEKAAHEEALNAATENAKRIVELNKQIAEANTAAKIKAESVSQMLTGLTGYADTMTFEKATGVDTNAGAADFVNKFLAAQGRLGSHQGTQGDQQTIALMNRLLAATKESDKTTYVLLETLLNELAGHKRQVKSDYEQLLMRVDRVHS